MHEEISSGKIRKRRKRDRSSLFNDLVGTSPQQNSSNGQSSYGPNPPTTGATNEQLQQYAEETNKHQEAQVSKHVSILRQGMGTVKQIAQTISDEIKSSRHQIDLTMDGMHSVESSMARTLKGIRKLAQGSGASYMCWMILFVLFFFFFCYWLLKKKFNS
mmetsp:Transcript_7458/g.11042  ORF Transcript_7458/g.11042 Transcript_7458/m.11042 type:complete len:160 (+) Transcript_7458:68-547(+)